ncbi:hypothetical protein SKAU_G00345190 [Synaphobranchus kaupii]|uniref:Uncharacterized protein n=1 Tax=Synaphobranchus kaupii TaxID=118154 RepID=A0A9Q1IHM2_SYNKA|nr:hypothetical protein SKAU_G00345190 [Synaphobranchus kaupii]
MRRHISAGRDNGDTVPVPLGVSLPRPPPQFPVPGQQCAVIRYADSAGLSTQLVPNGGGAARRRRSRDNQRQQSPSSSGALSAF